MNGWTVDKKIPLILVAGILFQTFCVGWWASSVEFRLQQNLAAIQEVKGVNERQGETIGNLSSTLTIIDTRTKDMWSFIRTKGLTPP